MHKNIYLCILLTTIVVQQGYKTKTQLQQLAEGNIKNTPLKNKNKKKTKDKNEKKQKNKTPYKTGQQELKITPNREQKTLQQLCKI